MPHDSLAERAGILPKGDLETARDMLARRYPNAHVWAYRKRDERGEREEFVLVFRAGTIEDLEEDLLSASFSVPAQRRLSHYLPVWARTLAHIFPNYSFRLYQVSGGYSVKAERVGAGDGPCEVITDRADEMLAALGEPPLDMRRPVPDGLSTWPGLVG